MRKCTENTENIRTVSFPPPCIAAMMQTSAPVQPEAFVDACRNTNLPLDVQKKRPWWNCSSVSPSSGGPPWTWPFGREPGHATVTVRVGITDTDFFVLRIPGRFDSGPKPMALLSCYRRSVILERFCPDPNSVPDFKKKTPF